MKYYFDNIIFNLQKAGGISAVWYNLIRNLTNFTNDIKFIEHNPNSNIFRRNLRIPKCNVINIKRFNNIFSQFQNLKITETEPFIFHSSYFRTCKNPNAVNVTTVHDFIYEQGNPTLKQKLRIKLNYKAIRDSDAIVCISQNTRKDLFKYLPDIDTNKVHVIYNGVSDDYKLLDKKDTYNQYNDYILFVGGRHGYKNFDFVIDCLKDTNYKLVICGSPLSEKELSTLEQTLPNRYKSITYPSNQELNKIYNSVYALAYPSSYEGFGIPVLEAQRSGCPVIALNVSSIPEIIGETPLLMNELSKSQFLEKLSLLKDRNVRDKIVMTGQLNSKKFSWVKMAHEYYNLYNKLLRERTQNQENSKHS